MRNYQTKTATRATVDEIVLRATVTVAMAELADAVRDGCWRSRSAPVCR
jgi:hypothetical protein